MLPPRNKRKLSLLLLIVGISIAQTPDSSLTPAVARVGSKLACLCGTCRNTVSTCPMLHCHYSEPGRERINKMAQEGKSDEEIIQAFVRETGIQALAVPPATGFNLLVWIMPWVAIALGLLVITWFVRRYTARRAVQAPAGTEMDPEVLSRYRENIEKDLSTLE
jgi:cytochrome c-type biogenesis protein CcmH